MATGTHRALTTLLLLAASLLASCTIKEVRIVCPCWMDVFFPYMEAPDTASVKSQAADTIAYRSSMSTMTIVDSADYFVSFRVPFDTLDINKCLEIKPPRRVLNFSVISGNTHAVAPDGSYVHEGDPEVIFDPLYACTSTHDCNCESLKDTAIVHKQYCGLTVTLSKFFDYASNDYVIVLRGESQGLNLFDLTPVYDGNKLVQKVHVSRTDGTALFNLPRQGQEDPISIDIYCNDTLYDSWQLLPTFKQISYDWAAEDLGDANFVITRAPVDFGIVVLPWDVAMDQDVEI